MARRPPSARLASWLGLLALVAGCGQEAPLTPGKAPRPKVPRTRREDAAGPVFDREWAAALPAAGFVYAAFDGEPILRTLESLVPPGPGGASRVPGLGSWLARLRRAAGEQALFPRGAALILAAGSSGPAEQVPLDFCLVAPGSGGLETALKQFPRDADGALPGAPRLFVGGDPGLRRLATRPGWTAPLVTQEVRWFQAARPAIRRRAGAFAILSPARYFAGPLGARTKARNAAEYETWRRWHGLFPTVTLEVEAFEGGLTVDLWSPLDPAHPAHAAVRGVFPADAPLTSPSRAPIVAPLFAAGALDWGALGALRRGCIGGECPPEAPAPPRPPSAFAGAAGGAPGPAASPGLDALRAAGGALGAALSEAVADWGGPEVALAATWDAAEPYVGALIQNRKPKRVVAKIREYRASEAGKKLRFVDGEAFGTPYRYTRVDGVDPRWLEPAYGFVGRNLCLASSRRLLESFLDVDAPKIEEDVAFGGLFARLGRATRVAAFLRPAVLPRWLALVGRMAGGEGAPPPPVPPALGSLATRVTGLALGAGYTREGRLQLTLVATRPEGAVDSPEPEGRR